MLGGIKVMLYFTESNITVISNFEMPVTSKIFQIHIWHFAYINFNCVAAHTLNSIEIREGKVENSTKKAVYYGVI